MGNIKSIKMKKQKALILIDLQNDYFEGGLYPLVGSLDAVLYSCILDISIQVAGFAALAFGALLRLIPQGWFDALADIVFHSHTVHGDTHTYGGFPVFQQFGFLDKEKHVE